MSGTKNKVIGLIGLSVMLVSLFSFPAFAIGSEDDGGNYIGPNGCKFCHIKEYETWSHTNHSRAFQILVDRKMDKNESCIPCHVTGYNNVTKTYKFRDVTCEVCHGSGDISNNIAEQVIEIFYTQNNKSQEEIHTVLAQLNLTKKSMIKNLTSEMCGRCHQGEHHPTYEEWNESLHSQSINTVKAQKSASDSCLKCQSVEWIVADEHNKPTLKEVTLGLTCAACHFPHTDEYSHMLRMPKEKLCESCHTMGEAKPGGKANHPHSEMRRSMNGIDADTYIYQPNAQCADCHRYTRSYNESLKQEGITGHDFKTNFNVCLKCHEGFPNAEEAEKFVRAQQAQFMEHYNATLVKVDSARNFTAAVVGPDRAIYDRVFNESLFNMQFAYNDKSKGAHNPKYAEELVHKAEIKADNILKGKPDAAPELPGFDFMTGFVVLSFAILVAAGRKR